LNNRVENILEDQKVIEDIDREIKEMSDAHNNERSKNKNIKNTGVKDDQKDDPN